MSLKITKSSLGLVDIILKAFYCLRKEHISMKLDYYDLTEKYIDKRLVAKVYTIK